MQMKTTWLLGSLILLASATACDAPDETFGEGDVTERCGQCGLKLNTSKFGFHPFAEVDTAYEVYNDIRLNYVKAPLLEGIVDYVFVTEGRLFAHKNGKDWPDKYLVNSEWKFTVADNGSKFYAYMYLKGLGYANGNPTYTFYNTYNGPGGTKEPTPICDDDPSEPGNQFEAILSNDIVIDPETAVVSKKDSKIYIACVSGGVGKAAKWGYPSFKHELIEFETAVRVVRADYCGTGDSFTKPGQAIQLRDIFGVSDFPSPNKPTEAIWGDSGAFCVGEPRLTSDWPTYTEVQKACEQLGAVPPKKCEPDMNFSTVPDSMFWSKVP